ncbi:MAG: amino acid carrier protein [bacterium]|nr:amino acid carrier protein [bacterium]
MNSKIFRLLIIVLFILLVFSFIVIPDIFSYLSKIVWFITSILILFSGIYFTKKLNFIQFKIKKLFTSFKEKRSSDGISTFSSFAMSLGARIGVGSLSGIAIAIYYGGVGTIFWIWVISLITSVNAYGESYLGVKYHIKKDNQYLGGPSYYIEKGLKDKKLGIIYAILIIFSYIFGFLTIQANTVVISVTNVFNINSFIIIIIILIFSSLVMFKDLKFLTNIISKTVIVMGILYLSLGLIVMIINYQLLIPTFILIIKSAFNIKSFSTGFLATFIIGFQRGIFSTEAGLGTSAIASSATNDTPYKQGVVQLLGVHLTSLIICSITAFIVISSNYLSIPWDSINGIEIIQSSFNYHFGSVGKYILMVITVLFAFSTIISGYYYGEVNLKYINKKISNKSLIIFKLLVLLLLLVGCLVKSPILWEIIDSLVVLLAIVNIYALLNLRNKIKSN